MADIVFNVSKGRGVEFHKRVAGDDPASAEFSIVLITGAITEATLKDLDTLAAILADAGATEATFTGYTRRTQDNAVLTFPGPDDASDSYKVDLNDESYTPSVVSETITWAIVCYDQLGTNVNASMIPWLGFDVSILTDNPFDLVFNAAGVMEAS